MTDYLWPPDIIPSSQTWGVLDPAGMFTSPLSGSVRTVSRPGARLRCMVTVPPIKGRDRRRLMAILGSLRGRSNRLWMPDYSVTREGPFPATELLTNNDFSNGTTGWSGGSVTQSASDRVLRSTRTGAGSISFQYNPSSATGVQYAPYVVRAFVARSLPSAALLSIGIGSTSTNNAYAYAAAQAEGLISASGVPSGTALHATLSDEQATGIGAGQYYDVSRVSLARCIQVDNGPNALLYSDQIDNAAWTKTGLSSVSANTVTAPDGSTTADALVEDAATSAHSVHQAVTVTSAAADYCLAIAVRASNRNWCALELTEGTGSTSVTQFFNVSTGATGTGATGASWSNRRQFVVDMGGGWYCLVLIGRKTNAATSITARIYAASADNTADYAGGSFAALVLWRATLAQSSAPVRLTQTTTTATTGTSQTGRSLYVKGLPASTQGLLRQGDPVQLGNQLNFVASDLDSDAAGKGLLTVGLPWRHYPADNDPVIVNTPMAKMILASEDINWDTGPGQFSSFQIELVEDVA
jgi:hypothetical protein